MTDTLVFAILATCNVVPIDELRDQDFRYYLMDQPDANSQSWVSNRSTYATVLPHFAGRLSGRALECVRKCADLPVTERPRNLRYMQIAVVKVTNGQITFQVLKYFRKRRPFLRNPSYERTLGNSQTASNVLHRHSAMRKQG